MKRILALDLGSHLGMAWRGADGCIRTARHFLPSGAGNHGLRVGHFSLELRATLKGLDPEGVAYERVPSLRGYAACQSLFGLEGVLLAQCEEAGLPYTSIAAREVKRVLTGRPTGGKPVEAACAQVGVPTLSEDEADAVGVLLCAEALSAATWEGR